MNAKVKVALLNVRKKPGGEVKTVLKMGEAVKVSAVKDGWAKTPKGYVMAEFLDIEEEADETRDDTDTHDND